jgi:NADH-quinone oxidoreductase subunit F
MKFYAHESCGQCTPCREGTGWLVDLLNGLASGNGRPEDVDLLVDVANNMMGNTICAFADGTAMPMLGFIRQFREEFVAAAKGGLSNSRLDASAKDLVVSGSVA